MRTFTRYTLDEYVTKVLAPVKAVVTFTEVHVHATWKPTIQQFRKDGGLALMQSMWRFHTGTQGWSDIGQHATIDPDGYVWDGRSLRTPPASSTNHNDSSPDNRHPFMFEMIGNFDVGQEVLQGVQLATSVGLTKAVMAQSKRGSDMVHFHREYDTQGKTCPGSGIDKSWFIGLIDRKEDGQPMTSEERILFDSLAEQVAALNKKASMPIPSWAKDAVKAAVKAKLIDTPDGRSQDFYSLVAILYRKGIIPK